jgi:hypothetical protein
MLQKRTSPMLQAQDSPMLSRHVHVQALQLASIASKLQRLQVIHVCNMRGLSGPLLHGNSTRADEMWHEISKNLRGELRKVSARGAGQCQSRWQLGLK